MKKLFRTMLATAMIGVTLASAPLADATVMLQLRAEKHVKQSDVIVRAHVLGQRSFVAGDGIMRTHTYLRVSEYIKGSGPRDITLQQRGGILGDLHVKVPGDAGLVSGEELILFLKHSQEPHLYLTAMGQSAYHISMNPDRRLIVWRDLHEIAFAERKTDGSLDIHEAADELPQNIDEFLTSLRRTVREVSR